MTKPDEYEILLAIRHSDPDGQATEPTDEDYRQFKAWVIATYGETIWQKYNGTWDEGSTE